MRLKCPSCAAEYDVAASMIPQDGRHVQCTACHTRWFVHPPHEPDPAEDRIIERLEAWSSRPRPVAVMDPVPANIAQAGDRPTDDDDPDAGENFVWDSPAGLPGAESSEVAEPAAPGIETGPGHEPDESAEPPAELAVLRPGIPQARAVPDQVETQAAETSEPPEPPAPAAQPEKTALRLDLTVDPDEAPAQPRPQSRFAKGLAIALAAFVIALAVYNFHDLIAVRVPQAAPAIEAYVQFVDDLRQRVSEQVAAFIDRP